MNILGICQWILIAVSQFFTHHISLGICFAYEYLRTDAFSHVRRSFHLIQFTLRSVKYLVSSSATRKKWNINQNTNRLDLFPSHQLNEPKSMANAISSLTHSLASLAFTRIAFFRRILFGEKNAGKTYFPWHEFGRFSSAFAFISFFFPPNAIFAVNYLYLNR